MSRSPAPVTGPTSTQANEELLTDSEHEPIESLAERVGRTEPEIPSIAIPLAPDRSLEHDLDHSAGGGRGRDDELGWEIG